MRTGFSGDFLEWGGRCLDDDAGRAGNGLTEEWEAPNWGSWAQLQVEQDALYTSLSNG